MSILVRTDGTAVVEDTKATPAAAADDSSDAVKTTDTSTTAGTTTGGTEAPAAATLGVSSGTGVDFSALTQEYEGKYDQQLADLYNQITQRKPFTYNSDDDMLYQQYVDRYTKGGQLAMEDTMGQAAALTGGYGNSYAQRVGQQTYDEYMTGLNDRLIELEDRAYGRWQDEGNALMQQYGMLGDLADTDYNRWKDKYAMTADQYDRYMTEAALLASAGSFDAYGNLFGEDSKATMQAVWAAQNLMPLYKAGQMDAETYKSIAGVYPTGYNPNASAAANYWDGGVWGPSSSGSKDDGEPTTWGELAQTYLNQGYTVGEVMAGASEARRDGVKLGGVYSDIYGPLNDVLNGK